MRLSPADITPLLPAALAPGGLSPLEGGSP